MELKTNIKKSRTLKDFTRLLIGFVCCLVGLSLYQQLSLYYGGVIDSPMNKTIFLLALNHLGFASMLSFILLLLFRFLEKSKPGMGFRATLIVFSLFLFLEALLIEHFTLNYSLLHLSDFLSGISLQLNAIVILAFMALILGTGLSYFLFYKLSWFLNPFIGKMFPFTIILFLLALSTSVTEKRPINQNKSLNFLAVAIENSLDFNEYEGVEYPLLRDWKCEDKWADYFKFGEKAPNLVFILMDGLSNEYVGRGTFSGFTPFLDSIAQKSLYWDRFLANSTSKEDAVANILGSLPHGKNGFTLLEESVNRNTLFGLLKANGYGTSFYYGGNASLNNLNKFLTEEQLDVIIDKSRFSSKYQLQEEDRAGVTLGYPDGELYKKWGATYFPSDKPRAEFFLNLSTSKPFSIPDAEKYKNSVDTVLKTKSFPPKEERFITKNKELFASLAYADNELQKLMEMYALTKDYNNTVFVITGSGKSHLPHENILEEHNVPLLFFSPMVKNKKSFQHIASHHDIAPSILNILAENGMSPPPKKTSWLGHGLLFKDDKKIMLSDNGEGLRGMVHQNHLVKGGEISLIKRKLQLVEGEQSLKKELKKELKLLKAINSYVTQENKILPEQLALYQTGRKEFTKEEMVWITSVFNGTHFDNAYETARDLAHEGEYQKALILCSYVLDKVPGHIDALILQGRIYGWKKEFRKSIPLLEKAVDVHPYYHDGYDALLDVYYWSGNNARASWLYERIKEHNIETVALVKKVERCMNQIGKIEEVTEIQFDE